VSEIVIPSVVEESALSVGALVARMAERIGADDARDLLSLLLDKPRHWTTLAKDEILPWTDVEAAVLAADRLASGMPLQYAAGRAAFRHLVLDVDPRVLIPRPETEILVDLVLEYAAAREGGIAVDVGTGSGAIAIALATEARFERVIATDVSADALAVASGNAARCVRAGHAPLELRQGSLLGPVTERGLRAVVSNPPYISFGEAAALPAAVRDWEPAVALFSPADGLAVTAKLVRDAATALAPDGLLALEVDERRARLVAELVSSAGAYGAVRVVQDLTGRERFVVARRLEDVG
jgi:release factor glutamine methyltransferase